MALNRTWTAAIALLVLGAGLWVYVAVTRLTGSAGPQVAGPIDAALVVPDPVRPTPVVRAVPLPTIKAGDDRGRSIAATVIDWCGNGGKLPLWTGNYAIEVIDIGKGRFNVIVEHAHKDATLSGHTLWYLVTTTKRGTTLTPQKQISADACRAVRRAARRRRVQARGAVASLPDLATRCTVDVSRARVYRRLMRTMRTMLILATLAAACTNTPTGGDDTVPVERGITEVVACSTEYKTVTRGADGSRSENYELRAELQTDLDPEDGWRVSAVACDLTVSPPDAPCYPYPGTECDARPRSFCTTATAGITDDGKLHVNCGNRIHHYDVNSTPTNVITRRYQRVTFHVAPAPAD